MNPTIPARMMNELAYCPRLFALEWLHGEWADNAHTVQGKRVHTRVDGPTRKGLREPAEADADDAEGPARPRAVRSVHLSDKALGFTARIDLVEESDDGRVVPIDYKKGAAPDLPEGAWEPERVQVAVQAMLLRAHGYRCDEGALWFAASRRRVAVPITPELEARVLALREEARRLARSDHGALPPPLVDSPKCDGCSLAGICLPDEVGLLTGARTTEVRPLVPGRDDGVPLYLELQGGTIGKSGGEVVVRKRREELARARISDTSMVVVHGNANLTTGALGALAASDVPVAVHSWGGWFRGLFVPASGVGALLRVVQHRVADAPREALVRARAIVRSKIRNQRVLLRRNGRPAPGRALDQMAELADQALEAPDHEVLLGIEGAAARAYFGALDTAIAADLKPRFAVTGRNRRPPKDPVNALLSFAYACLVREWTQVLHRVGFDPYRGFLHQPRHNRPALALDLMEEFRPVVADSVVLSAINNGVTGPDAFLVHPTGVSLTDAGRRAFLRAWERRLDTLATHPLTGTRVSMRRMFELHARLWARHLHGELAEPPTYGIR